jgi:hypothetical protein
MQPYNFDATNITPQQGAGAHPAGMFPFVITNTFGQDTKAKDGAMLCVVMTSNVGSITNRYNIFNASEAAMEIAKKELSALCHATGVFVLTIVDGNNQLLPYDQWAREIRNARGVMEIGPQANDPKYMEVKKVYDQAGNEPGKSPGAAPQPQGQGGGGSWGAGAPAQNNPPASTGGQGGAWAPNSGSNPPANNPPAQGGWQPGPTGGAPASGGAPGNPPWAGGGQK